MTQYSDKLSAFLDGELPEDEALEIEHALEGDPALQAELEALMAVDSAVKDAFDEMLGDPVPFGMAAAIQTAPTSTSANTAPASSRRGWMAAAAAVVALAIGGAGGYLTGISQSPQVAAAPGWLADIADYHRVYAGQTRHLVEVPADEADHIETWLTATVGADVRIPDLTQHGLTFQGGRLLVAAGKPVAQLMYTDADMRVVALCLIQNDTPQDGFANRQIGAFEMVTWGGAGANFVIVGDEGRGDLDQIARTASAET